MIYLGLVAAVVGFGVAAYIHRHVTQKKPLMCPRNAPCDEVVNSTYGTTMGMRNTYLGMAYYGGMAVLFLLLLAGVSFPLQWLLMRVLSAAAGLFSLYLVFVQSFILRKWCVWCLTSAVLSIVLVVCIFFF